MKIIALLIFVFSFSAYAEQEAVCNFEKTKEVSFTNKSAKDKLNISINGETCSTSRLELKLVSENGKIIHTHEESFSRWHWPKDQLRGKILDYAEKLLNESIISTSELIIEFKCEIEEPNCIPYERNLIPMEKYLSLKSKAVPMIQHSSYYEVWAAWVYDSEQQKVIKVYEGGL